MTENTTPPFQPDKIVEDLRLLARDAEALLSPTAGVADSKLDDLRSRLTTAVHNARGTCERLQGKAAEQIRRGLHETGDQTVRAHPWEAVGVALESEWSSNLLSRR